MKHNKLDIQNFRTLKTFFSQDYKGKIFNKSKIIFKKKLLINFSSNDYLGLSQNKILKKRSILWTKKYGTGIASSRLVTGNYNFIENLEHKIANFKNYESGTILSSGFQCNSTVIPSLLENTLGRKKEAIIFCDKLNHYSLNLGCFLSRQNVLRYNHLDFNHLEKLLKKNKHKRNKLIVTETLFSMDGDSININDIRLLANKYDCMLYLDEAHSIGVRGVKGFGVYKDYSLKNDNEILIGTFSKAFGAYGSYVLCSYENKKKINNFCSGFIYSTALPPNVLGAIEGGFELIPKMNKEREKLDSISKYLRAELKKIGFNTMNSDSHIIPLLISDINTATKIHDSLVNKGFFVSLIRPPTVPQNRTRLRISLSSSISMRTINNFIRNLETVAKN